MLRREDIALFLEALDVGQPGEAAGLLMNIPPDVQDWDGTTPLMFAAQQGWADCLSELLPHSNANQCMGEGYRALDYALIRGNPDAIRLLMPETDCKTVNSRGETILWLAAVSLNDGDVFEELLTQCDPLKRNKQGETALMGGAGRKGQTSSHWWTPLLRVSDLHACDHSGYDALMHAAMSGNAHLCKDLLQAGANAEKRANDGQTALVLAVRALSEPCAQLLLPWSDPLSIDNEQCSVFDWAVKEASNASSFAKNYKLANAEIHNVWGCVDVLSSWVAPATAAAAFEKAGAAHMPRYAAQFEHEILKKTLANGSVLATNEERVNPSVGSGRARRM